MSIHNPGNPNRVLPSGNELHVYTDDRLGMPEMDLDNLIDGAVETRFVMSADMKEGVSGKLEIDTTYENTSETEMDVVRSDVTRYEDTPAPHDTKLHMYPHRRH